MDNKGINITASNVTNQICNKVLPFGEGMVPNFNRLGFPPYRVRSCLFLVDIGPEVPGERGLKYVNVFFPICLYLY